MNFDSRLLSGIGVLAAVIDAGSFMRAGEALGLTQSAVSRAVSRLEQRIGIRIFHRNARSITLTDDGRRFYESVAPNLANIEDAAIRAAGAGAEVRGRLRVNVDGCFAHYVLTPRIRPFLERYPELSVEIAVRDRMGDLVADGFDVGEAGAKRRAHHRAVVEHHAASVADLRAVRGDEGRPGDLRQYPREGSCKAA